MKRKRNRRRRGIGPKLLIFAVLFVAALAFFGIRWYRSRTPEVESTTIQGMSAATLPTVSFEYANRQIDLQHGYVSELNVSTVRSSLLPLAEDLMVHARVNTYGTAVDSIGYELLSVDGSRLIASAEALDASQDGNEITADFSLPGLVDAETEYMLKLILLVNGRNVNYYTRVRLNSSTNTLQMIDFADRFSAATFNSATGLETIVDYMESDSTSADNDDLGYVSLLSSPDQVMWGSLDPTLDSEKRMYINEYEVLGAYSGTALGLTYEYEVRANVDGLEHVYSVREYYLMRRYDDQTIYLMNYERTMDDVTGISPVTIDCGKIDLGILSPENKASDCTVNGSYAVFSAAGQLWEYCADGNVMINVFGFDDTGVDGVRENFREHGFDILNIEEDGTLLFAVYGYMNRGAREGESGLGLFSFKPEGRELTELLFISTDRPYEQLRAEITKLSCLDSNGVYYLLIDNSIYSVDNEGHQAVCVVDSLRDGTFAVSADGTRLAWAEGEGRYGYSAVYCMNLSRGLTFDPITANVGEELSVLGFAGPDLIVGTHNLTDEALDENGSTICPMNAFTIYSESSSSQEEGESEDAGADDQPETEMTLSRAVLYEGGAYRITSVEADDLHVTIHRVVKASGEDHYQNAQDDTLIRNASAGGDSEPADTSSSLRSQVNDDTGKTYYLDLFTDIAISGVASMTTPSETVIMRTDAISIQGSGTASSNYYAYACGRLRGVYGNVNAAVEAVRSDMGLVTTGSQRVVWTRLTSN